MEGRPEAMLEVSSNRKREVPTFFDKVNSLLRKTENVMMVIPGGSNDRSFAALKQSFANVTSLQEVLDALGGKDALASRLLLSVMDEDERSQLELFGKRRKLKKRTSVTLDQIRSLVDEIQTLANQVKDQSDPLIAQVMAIKASSVEASSVEEQDATGSGVSEIEQSKRRPRSATKKSKPVNDTNETFNKNKKSKKTGNTAVNKTVNKAVNKAVKKSVTNTSHAVVSAAELDEDEAPIEAAGLTVADVMRMLKDAEKEFSEIRLLKQQQQQQQPVDGHEAWEGPPNVEELIMNASMEDVECFTGETNVVAVNSIEGRSSLQMWWRIVKRACQIRGVFKKIREDKSKVTTIEERYKMIVTEKLGGRGLKFAQASNYERLGKFLSECPCFVFQRQWTTLAHWLQRVSDKNAVLLDCIVSIAPLSSVFLRDAFSLHKDGFQVYHGLMMDCISVELVQLVKSRLVEDGEAVFNNCKNYDSRRNDNKRLQLAVEKIKSNDMSHFDEVLTNRLAELVPGHKKDSMVGLLSMDGCKAQLAHTDFTPDFLKCVVDDNQMPLACLIALTDGTMFDVWPGAIRFDKSRKIKPMSVRLEAGDVLIFRGDLVHGGAAAKESNVRLHAYLEVVHDGMDGAQSRPKHEDGVEHTHFMCDEPYILKRQSK